VRIIDQMSHGGFNRIAHVDSSPRVAFRDAGEMAFTVALGGR
jgi:hypothetical protein